MTTCISADAVAVTRQKHYFSGTLIHVSLPSRNIGGAQANQKSDAEAMGRKKKNPSSGKPSWSDRYDELGSSAGAPVTATEPDLRPLPQSSNTEPQSRPVESVEHATTRHQWQNQQEMQQEHHQHQRQQQIGVDHMSHSGQQIPDTGSKRSSGDQHAAPGRHSLWSSSGSSASKPAHAPDVGMSYHGSDYTPPSSDRSSGSGHVGLYPNLASGESYLSSSSFRS